eukprot:TRINITY_DN25_c0_g1_i1.p1 TRINITY_DN25_c0_g1~~TRINITY_DN25_c0_g1_i1.p1  ORF type:complete len:263 (+),score=82.90 TRINITY_DN25_c0_g1_i1:48-836(+)
MEAYDRAAGSLLGAGTFGEVFSATHKSTGQKVALKKILNASYSVQIRNEIDAGSKLQHPSIPRFIESFTDENEDLYMAFELLEDCKDLYSFLEQRSFRPLPEPQAKALFLQLVRALQYVHEQNIAHMDIKLDNVMISADQDKVYLIDFGLSRSTAPGVLSRHFCGNNEYIAPEIIQKVPYDPKAADIHSLGVVFYAMLFGEFPYDLDQRTRALRNVGRRLPPVVFPAAVAASDDTKLMILDMIKLSPSHRISLEEIEAKLSF